MKRFLILFFINLSLLTAMFQFGLFGVMIPWRIIMATVVLFCGIIATVARAHDNCVIAVLLPCDNCGVKRTVGDMLND